jgi:hypothetical protein
MVERGTHREEFMITALIGTSTERKAASDAVTWHRKMIRSVAQIR